MKCFVNPGRHGVCRPSNVAIHSLRASLAIVAILACQTSTLAQSAIPTTNVIFRIRMIQSKFFKGTIFSIDVDQHEYWITAKHILTGAEHPPYGSVADKSVSLQILNPDASSEKWDPVTFSVIDTEKDVDIVVLAPSQPLLDNPLPSVPADSTAALFGGDCEFLGFPYGGGWRARVDTRWLWLPYIKHCVVSALNKEGLQIWILDGINNEGFSGGPVIFRTGPDQKIMAVISGYHPEPANVIPAVPANSSSPKPNDQPKEIVNVNSGFIISYDIKYAIDAIQKNPIGPLRKPH